LGRNTVNSEEIAMIYTKNLSENSLRGSAVVAAGVLLIAAFPVWAHHPMGGMTPQTFSQGLLSGLGHPIIGLDHFAFLVVAMLLSCTLKGAARYLAPLAFVAARLAGTVLHLGAANIPMSETLVALSVVIGGVLALTRSHPGALLLTAGFAASGVLHGYAYGESIVGAEATPMLAYLAGFAAIQSALILGGVLGLGRLAAYSERARLLATRVSGVAALMTGGLFLAMSLT